MMAKKDGDIKSDVERPGPEEDACSGQEPHGLKETREVSKTEVKNAHAVGMGAIGRHDEKTDTGEEGHVNY
ncbi:MAG: hypothetical protein ACXVMS_06520 [Flavisolibacter sp.]